ncbi:MAG: XTP/dITP diphosphatase [Firmicutes bacterium]|nr:XTP/dITP diphosphatase [Clostridiales bacterium]MBQ4340608.1 XTP/dITP diphosphatase [Bacillota bacterium]
MLTVIAATQNKHKLTELRSIMEKFGMEVISQSEAGLGDIDVVEDGDTFEANSFKKANEIMKLSGKIAVADDSGLAVDYLGGAPGVYSARYAGEHKSDLDNNNKLLAELDGVENRRASFVSVVTMVYPDGKVIAARGECPGTIIHEPRGDGGFGYDPLFVPDGFEKTFAQITAEEKNTVSHRAKALEKLEEMLNK